MTVKIRRFISLNWSAVQGSKCQQSPTDPRKSRIYLLPHLSFCYFQTSQTFPFCSSFLTRKVWPVNASVRVYCRVYHLFIISFLCFVLFSAPATAPPLRPLLLWDSGQNTPPLTGATCRSNRPINQVFTHLCNFFALIFFKRLHHSIVEIYKKLWNGFRETSWISSGDDES